MTDQTNAATDAKQKTAKPRATRKDQAKRGAAPASASKPSLRKRQSNPTPATKEPTKRDRLAALLFDFCQIGHDASLFLPGETHRSPGDLLTAVRLFQALQRRDLQEQRLRARALRDL